jgi:hypothetical protein
MVIPMSTTTKITLVRQLANEYVSPSDRKALKGILKEIKDCAEIRNSLVHGFYGAKKGKFNLITHSGSGRFSGQPISWTPNDLQSLVKRILAAAGSVAQLRPLFPARLPQPKNRHPIAASVGA